PIEMDRLRNNSKSSKVRMLLTTTDYGARDIGNIVECHPDLVRKIRRQMRLPYERETTKARLERLEQDIRDLRAQVLHYCGQERLDQDVQTPKQADSHESLSWQSPAISSGQLSYDERS